jgi:chromosome partitioning protein
MRRVVFNQKGGVGKSSITCNLAAISAQQGARTLVIDLDPQANSTHYLLGEGLLGEEAPQPETIAGYFSQTLSFNLTPKKPLEFVTATPYENLSVIAADAELESIEQKLESRHKVYKLRDLLNKLDKDFDEIFIDTAPALNFYTMSALIAADSVLIPFDCDAFSRQALYNILYVIAETREDHNEDLNVEGIIVNQFQSRANLPTQVVEELKAEGHPVIPIYLNSSIKMRESHQSRKPLIHMAPSHALTQKYMALYQHITNTSGPTVTGEKDNAVAT